MLGEVMRWTCHENTSRHLVYRPAHHKSFVVQWLEHLTGVRKILGSLPVWDSDFVSLYFARDRWITSLLTRIQARCVLRSLINPFFILLLEQVNTAKDEGISVCSCWYCNWFNQCCFLGNPVLPFILANREKRRKKNRLEKLRKKKKKEAQITKETASGT